MEAAKSYRTTQAISKLNKARKADARLRGAFQGKIKQALAEQYSYIAGRAFAGKAYAKAGRNARKALGFAPGHSSAQAVYNQVLTRAEGWLAQAKSSAGSNPDKAMALLQKVLAVFDKNDARYQQAYDLLNKLADEQDE